MRGLWKHETSYHRLKENWGYKWVKDGRLPPSRKGCGKWNVYKSTKTMKPTVIDVKCKYCGVRVKFQPKRQDNRGAPTPAVWMERPDHMPLRAMIDEMKARNRLVDISTDFQGFQKASDLRMGGNLE